MEVHDVRGRELGYIGQVCNRFPAGVYNEHSINHTFRLTTDEDIDNCIDKAHDELADMVMIQEYGISWYVPVYH